MVKNIPKSIARQIHLSAKEDSSSFSKQFTNYISAKQFYALKESCIMKLSYAEFLNQLCDFFLSCGSTICELELERLVQLSNKTTVALRYLQAKKNGKSSDEYQSIMKDILLIKIESSIFFSGYLTSSFLESVRRNKEPLDFVCPVCPDYSYVAKEGGRYEYTFKELGSGIGLVATRAVNNVKVILSFAEQIKLEKKHLNMSILVGDFEANEQNCISLNESQSSFTRKCFESSLAIKEKVKIANTGVFTNLCGGLQEWPHILRFVKQLSNLEVFDDLVSNFPALNHEKSLLSRIPLYRRWFKGNTDIKSVFLSQILEYATMGFIVFSQRNKNSILLASDHIAMRQYYNLICPLTVFGSSLRY